MSGWGDSLVAGFQAGVDAKDRARRRKLDEADQALRKDLTEKQMAADIQKMHESFGFQSDEAAKDRDWRTGERTGSQDFTAGQGLLDRNFRTSERMGAQDFQGTQGQLDRDARMAALDRQLRQEAQLTGAKQTFDRSRFDWEKDPTNPNNMSHRAYAYKLMNDGTGDGTGTDLPPQFGQDSEGRTVIAPNGKKYIIKNGVPVEQ